MSKDEDISGRRGDRLLKKDLLERCQQDLDKESDVAKLFSILNSRSAISDFNISCTRDSVLPDYIFKAKRHLRTLFEEIAQKKSMASASTGEVKLDLADDYRILYSKINELAELSNRLKNRCKYFDSFTANFDTPIKPVSPYKLSYMDTIKVRDVFSNILLSNRKSRDSNSSKSTTLNSSLSQIVSDSKQSNGKDIINESTPRSKLTSKSCSCRYMRSLTHFQSMYTVFDDNNNVMCIEMDMCRNGSDDIMIKPICELCPNDSLKDKDILKVLDHDFSHFTELYFQMKFLKSLKFKAGECQDKNFIRELYRFDRALIFKSKGNMFRTPAVQKQVLDALVGQIEVSTDDLNKKPIVLPVSSKIALLLCDLTVCNPSTYSFCLDCKIEVNGKLSCRNASCTGRPSYICISDVFTKYSNSVIADRGTILLSKKSAGSKTIDDYKEYKLEELLESNPMTDIRRHLTHIDDIFLSKDDFNDLPLQTNRFDYVYNSYFYYESNEDARFLDLFGLDDKQKCLKLKVQNDTKGDELFKCLKCDSFKDGAEELCNSERCTRTRQYLENSLRLCSSYNLVKQRRFFEFYLKDYIVLPKKGIESEDDIRVLHRAYKDISKTPIKNGPSSSVGISNKEAVVSLTGRFVAVAAYEKNSVSVYYEDGKLVKQNIPLTIPRQTIYIKDFVVWATIQDCDLLVILKDELVNIMAFGNKNGNVLENKIKFNLDNGTCTMIRHIPWKISHILALEEKNNQFHDFHICAVNRADPWRLQWKFSEEKDALLGCEISDMCLHVPEINDGNDSNEFGLEFSAYLVISCKYRELATDHYDGFRAYQIQYDPKNRVFEIVQLWHHNKPQLEDKKKRIIASIRNIEEIKKNFKQSIGKQSQADEFIKCFNGMFELEMLHKLKDLYSTDNQSGASLSASDSNSSAASVEAPVAAEGEGGSDNKLRNRAKMIRDISIQYSVDYEVLTKLNEVFSMAAHAAAQNQFKKAEDDFKEAKKVVESAAGDDVVDALDKLKRTLIEKGRAIKALEETEKAKKIARMTFLKASSKTWYTDQLERKFKHEKMQNLMKRCVKLVPFQQSGCYMILYSSPYFEDVIMVPVNFIKLKEYKACLNNKCPKFKGAHRPLQVFKNNTAESFPLGTTSGKSKKAYDSSIDQCDFSVIQLYRLFPSQYIASIDVVLTPLDKTYDEITPHIQPFYNVADGGVHHMDLKKRKGLKNTPILAVQTKALPGYKSFVNAFREEKSEKGVMLDKIRFGSSLGPFSVGDEVEANYLGYGEWHQEKWYPEWRTGKISGVNYTYDIEGNNVNVPENCIINASGVTSSSNTKRSVNEEVDFYNLERGEKCRGKIISVNHIYDIEYDDVFEIENDSVGKLMFFGFTCFDHGRKIDKNSGDVLINEDFINYNTADIQYKHRVEKFNMYGVQEENNKNNISHGDKKEVNIGAQFELEEDKDEEATSESFWVSARRAEFDTVEDKVKVEFYEYEDDEGHEEFRHYVKRQEEAGDLRWDKTKHVRPMSVAAAVFNENDKVEVKVNNGFNWHTGTIIEKSNSSGPPYTYTVKLDNSDSNSFDIIASSSDAELSASSDSNDVLLRDIAHESIRLYEIANLEQFFQMDKDKKKRERLVKFPADK